MKSHLPSAQGPTKDQRSNKDLKRFLSKHFAVHDTYSLEVYLAAAFWKKADPPFSNGNHHIQVIGDAMLFYVFCEYTTFSTCTHKPSPFLKRSNVQNTKFNKNALSTFNHGNLWQFFLWDNLWAELGSQPGLFEPSGWKLGNLWFSPSPPPQRLATSSQVCGAKLLPAGHPYIRGWEVTRFQQNTGIDGIDIQHMCVCSHVCVYDFLLCPNPKHSNCIPKKHAPEPTPGGRQPHRNRRWPCAMSFWIGSISCSSEN